MGTSADSTVVILGAGLSGLSAAWQLVSEFGRRVVVLEKEPQVGGLARTLATGEGHRYDLGSHRIHEGFLEEPLMLVQSLLDGKILQRRRQGRIRLNDKFMGYPPSLLELLRNLGPVPAIRAAKEYLALKLGLRASSGASRNSYEGHLLEKVGPTLYEQFYAPYAWKVFGIDPRQISYHACKVRFRGESLPAVIMESLRARIERERVFHYPLFGIGMLAEALAEKVVELGGTILTDACPQEIRITSEKNFDVFFEHQGRKQHLEAEHLISSAPIGSLLGLFPFVPKSVLESARELKWRGLRLLYLVLERDSCGPSETYYFLERKYLFGRISEPKKFSPAMCKRPGETILCLEIPCTVGDRVWSQSDAGLFQVLEKDLSQLGFIGGREEILRYFSMRLPEVYPLYDLEWEARLENVQKWLESLPGCETIGRGGFFWHNNMDHAILSGLKVGEFLGREGDDGGQWRNFQRSFRAMRVRD